MEVMHQMGDETLVRRRVPGRDDVTLSHNIVNNGGSCSEKETEEEVLSENSDNFDENAGTATDQWPLPADKNIKQGNADIKKVLNSVINDQDHGTKDKSISYSESSRNGGNEHVKIDIEEESEEEVLQLEFERAVAKMHTHSIYCPNCNSQVTKVILRKKKPKSTIPSSPGKIKPGEDDKPVGLLGCLSCFSLFIPSGNCLNSFRIFGTQKEPEGTQIYASGVDDQVHVPLEPGYFAHGSKSLEILKSIVYGGLMESITSLSIVSSAAASDSTTRNIVALGLANAIGGVFIIGHNLRDMKNDCRVEDFNQETDRYQKLIGRRENFLLHFSFAILSFLVFGLIPPVVYGFAFEESHNEDFKLVAVVAASLICIILLAIAKAYCKGGQRFSEYIKTTLYYATMAIAVSGVAYAIGNQIEKLVEKIGWFEPNTPTPATLFNSGVNSATPFKASY